MYAMGRHHEHSAVRKQRQRETISMQSNIPTCPSPVTTQQFVRSDDDRSDFCARTTAASQPTPERTIDLTARMSIPSHASDTRTPPSTLAPEEMATPEEGLTFTHVSSLGLLHFDCQSRIVVYFYTSM